jgi:hypothetical protein
LQPSLEFVVQNDGDISTGALSVTLTAVDFTITSNECQGKALPGHDSCRIAVRFGPTKIGAAPATLAVAGDPGGRLSASPTGTAEAAPALSLVPRSVTFPDTIVGAASTPVTVTVTNVGDAKAGTSTILQVGIQGELQFRLESTTCGTTLDSGATCEAAVSFRPLSVGSRSASLAVGAVPGGFVACALTGLATAGTTGGL